MQITPEMTVRVLFLERIEEAVRLAKATSDPSARADWLEVAEGYRQLVADMPAPKIGQPGP